MDLLTRIRSIALRPGKPTLPEVSPTRQGLLPRRPVKRHGFSTLLAWCHDMDAREGVSPVEVEGEQDAIAEEAGRMADADRGETMARARELLARRRPA